jgi:hypothetical protein
MVSYAPPTFNLPIFEPSAFGLPATSGISTANFLTKAVAAATYQTIGTVYSYLQTSVISATSLPFNNANLFTLPTGVYTMVTMAYCYSFSAPSSTNYLYNFIQLTGAGNNDILYSQIGVPNNILYTIGSTNIITISSSASVLWSLGLNAGTMSVSGESRSFTYVRAVKLA